MNNKISLRVHSLLTFNQASIIKHNIKKEKR